MSSPIRIFVAATAAEWLPAKVLEFSIREHCSRDIQLVRLCELGKEIPEPQSWKNKARTPFSFQRFLIPQACDYQGKAIYLDSDMLVFQDISRLWELPFNGAKVLSAPGVGGRRSQFSVMLLNCALLNWNITDIVKLLDEEKLTYDELMFEMRLAQPLAFGIGSHWNSLEHFSPTGTALLHYTDMQTQPWVSAKNPLGYLWIECLRRAIEQRFISNDELTREVKLGHVRPSLLIDLASSQTTATAREAQPHDIDRHYVAPFKSLIQSQRGSIVARMAARFRQVFNTENWK